MHNGLGRLAVSAQDGAPQAFLVAKAGHGGNAGHQGMAVVDPRLRRLR